MELTLVCLTKIAAGRSEHSRPAAITCSTCGIGCCANERVKRRCRVQSPPLRERELVVATPLRPGKKVLVVGAGAAGLRSPRVWRRTCGRSRPMRRNPFWRSSLTLPLWLKVPYYAAFTASIDWLTGGAKNPRLDYQRPESRKITPILFARWLLMQLWFATEQTLQRRTFPV